MNKNRTGIASAGIAALVIIFMIYSIAQDSPDRVTDIVKHWSIAWLKGGVISGILMGIIFIINKYVQSEKNMSLLGMVIITPLLPTLITVLFGYHPVMIATGIVAGIVIGYFTYIIDDHLLDLWEIRHITLPIVLGLGFGGSVIIACIYENWQDEHVYVNDHATCTELTVERYTYHYRKAKRGGPYYSWDYHTTHYYFERGHGYKKPVEGVDFTLGTGALGKKDRASESYHDWIGGLSFTKQGPVQKWIYMDDANLNYHDTTWYEIEENFFGHAIHNGKVIKPITEAHPKSDPLTLPTSEHVPGLVNMTIDFFKIMLLHPDFALLRTIYLLMYLPLLIFVFFVAEYRISFILFLTASTIIILIIILVALTRSGGNISRRSFEGFGGGKFGGGGAGSRW